MKKIILLMALIILMISSGCNFNSEIIPEQSDIIETAEETKTEPTKTSTSTPTVKPAETPTPDLTASPEPTPESTLTPTPEPTPTPKPEPTPTPKPELKPDSKSSDIDELFEHMADGTDIKEAPVLEIPDSYLGNGVPGDFNMRAYVAEDDDGNIYYTDFYNIYIINISSRETKMIFLNADIEEKFDFGVEYSQALPSYVYYKDGKLYAYITVEYEPYEFMNFMVDIFGEKVLYGTTEEINFSYDSRIIRSYYDNEKKSQIYKQYTLTGNADRNMFDISTDYNNFSLRYVSDKYLFSIGNKYSWDDAYSYLDYSHLLVIDKDTMKTTAIIKDSKFSLIDSVILLCKDEWMLLYDKNEGAVKIYNLVKGEIKTYWRFEGFNTYLGYDPDECCVYIRKSTGYTHLENTFDPGYPHDFFEECISEEELPNANEIFVKYNLLTLEEEVMNTIKSADYMSRYLCFDFLKDFVVGDYLFVYSYIMEESYIPLSYVQKFKLGEEINYNTWRD